MEQLGYKKFIFTLLTLLVTTNVMSFLLGIVFTFWRGEVPPAFWWFILSN